MASKLFNRSRPMNFDVNPSPETFYHIPISPSEPGKFDFYRVHLTNQDCHSNSIFSDNSDVPTLFAQSSTANRRWSPFADIVTSNQSKSSVSTSSSSLNSFVTLNSQTINSSVMSNTSNIQNETMQSVASFPSLTDIVKNAMSKTQVTSSLNQIRRPTRGTTLSTKDLNHLSPQSM
ncbi:unnamed protein product [Adineta steineri]|uniref:Uncharacterized protein n=1 Tax=Adineta steineri TaxID=433720 RepID=A0A813M4R9_9BILA|nr:unnamed protein product [Adineta steineri]CAF1395918.1 unnamed protein product [Adineta steineri]CAF3652560.1 unnamed protein product [Adineta steineri]CAF4044323.1 unnamed protein product [Adineta steineri]